MQIFARSSSIGEENRSNRTAPADHVMLTVTVSAVKVEGHLKAVMGSAQSDWVHM
jgi:hypothetical protein